MTHANAPLTPAGRLRLVERCERRPIAHVAAEAGISKGTLTGVLSTLESRGLLTRRPHPGDARRVLVALTPRGEELMRELFPAFNGQESVVTAPLAPDERQQLADLLRAVVRGLDRP